MRSLRHLNHRLNRPRLASPRLPLNERRLFARQRLPGACEGSADVGGGRGDLLRPKLHPNILSLRRCLKVLDRLKVLGGLRSVTQYL